MGGWIANPQQITGCRRSRSRRRSSIGTNLFDLVLIFLVHAFYPGGPVLNEVGRFSLFGALLGIALTTVYLAGVVERRDRGILRMGVDSLAVLITYLSGLVLLYQLR